MAVLVNVFLLTVLMIGAIIFDRYYFKKLNASRMNRGVTGIIGSSGAFSHSTYPQSDISTSNQQGLNLDNLRFYNGSINDTPPQYPGYYPVVQLNTLTLANNHSSSNKTNSAIILIATEIESNHAEMSTNTNNLKSESKSIHDEKKENKSIMPPLYNELYPEETHESTFQKTCANSM